MNNRIMALLCALVAAMFISIVPVEAEAAVAEHTCYDDNKNCVCDFAGCTKEMHVANGTCDSETDGHYQWCLNDCGTKLKQEKHNYGAFKNQGAAQHWRTCADCGYIDKVSHSDGTKIDCVCDDCGASLGHKLEQNAGYEAKCEVAGIKWHYECTTCGKFFWDSTAQSETSADAVVIPALKHEAGTVWDYDENSHYHWCWRNDNTKMDVANHTFRYVSQGRDMHDKICTVCGYKERVVHSDRNADCACDDCGEAMQHTLVTVAEVPRSCLVDGVAAYQKCSTCGTLFDMSGVQINAVPKILAIGYHDMGSYVYQDVREGNHYTMCKNCGYELHEPHVMVLENPLKGNYHQWLCECGELKTEIHYDKNGDSKCDECSHNMGSTSVTVEQHDSVTVVTGDKDTISSTKSWWENWLDNLKPSSSGGTTSTKDTTTSSSGTTSGNTGSGTGSTGTTSGNTGSGTGSTGTTSGNTGSGTGSTGTPSGNTGSSSGNTGTPSGNGSTAANNSMITGFFQWLGQKLNAWFANN